VGTRMTLVSTICRMPAMKPVGERSAGNPHAAFDERGRETEQCYRARPRLYRAKPASPVTVGPAEESALRYAVALGHRNER